jgi:hypothetical protein
MADLIFAGGDGRTELFEEGRPRAGHFDGDGFVFGAVGEEDAFAREGLSGQVGFEAGGNESREARDSCDPVRVGNGKRVGQCRALAEADEVDRARIVIEIRRNFFE